ncbi:hypothetical protein GQ457_02G023980 [Hibiscus cannabinus]
MERVSTFEMFIFIEGLWLCESSASTTVNIYDPCDAAAQNTFWDSLLSVKNVSNKVWILAGDFNVIRFSHERKGCVTRNTGTNAFNNFTEKDELPEVRLFGKRFTWFGSAGKMSKLHTFLVFEKWFQDQSDFVEICV